MHVKVAKEIRTGAARKYVPIYVRMYVPCDYRELVNTHATRDVPTSTLGDHGRGMTHLPGGASQVRGGSRG